MQNCNLDKIVHNFKFYIITRDICFNQEIKELTAHKKANDLKDQNYIVIFDENQIDMIKTFILYENELLLFAYKSLVKNKRNLLLMIEQYLKNDFCNTEILKKFKEVISAQIKKCCIEMINIVDAILIHREKDIESQIFYEKHKADYYRYICESDPDEKTINKSQQCYDKAFEIAKDKISSSSSLYLGLILNYSVFLYDIKKQTQKAIEISQKACNEAKDFNDSDAPGIISLILENIQFWTDEC